MGYPNTAPIEIETTERLATASWSEPTNLDNPRNWSFGRKVYHTFVTAIYAFTVTFMSSIYASGYADVGRHFNVSESVSLLGVALFCFGLAFGPVLAAPLSETFGRSLIYKTTLPISIFFVIGSAVSKTFAGLVICRFFAGFFCSPGLSVGGGTNADLWGPSARGSIHLAASATSPTHCFVATGPVIGGFVEEKKGWRWLEWTIVFFAIPTSFSAIFMSETYKKTILERNMKRDGLSPNANVEWVTALKAWISVSLIRPLAMLFGELITLLFGLYVALNFGILYSFLAATPFVFETVYGFDRGKVGLTFLSLCAGTIFATGTYALIDTFYYRKKLRKGAAAGVPESVVPEDRLYAAMVGSFGLPIGLFWFGWTARQDIHWISPVLAMFPFAWGNVCVFTSAVTYLIESYGPAFGASALASNGFARYIFAAAFPLFTGKFYRALTIPWATSLLGFVSLLMIPIPWGLYKWGSIVRKRSRRAQTTPN
ncbi:MFS general substrate transporter [Rhizodiscina lignyota]|uniref:MFS general substrate transporter n=1 Tax=Rhizodiscina lignyota TaxID=1504668 RepID=A0A9P4I2X8_9PEZI|nr:MFS general substrate transporter [Rhizodiscina lignyota]